MGKASYHIYLDEKEVMLMNDIWLLLDLILRLTEVVIQFLSYNDSKKDRR